MRPGRGLDPAGLAIFFALLGFVGITCSEVRSETVHIANLAASGCIAATHSFFQDYVFGEWRGRSFDGLDVHRD
jgi:hypothetical protein